MIQYGLISKVDAACLEKTIDLICNEFRDAHPIRMLEIGVYGGETGNGVRQYAQSRWREVVLTGIDNNKDGEEVIYFYNKLIIGNSNEVYNQLEDESQHLILVDANHSFPYVISDWFCYTPKVKKGGYICLHDTAPQAQGRDWQRVGSEEDLDMYISTRKALRAIGFTRLLDEHFTGFKCVFDEFDPNDRCGGICVFKKL